MTKSFKIGGVEFDLESLFTMYTFPDTPSGRMKKQFYSSLIERGRLRGIKCRVGMVARGWSQHLIRLLGAVDCTLYVRSSAMKPPFWGANYSALDLLMKSSSPHLVLLFQKQDVRNCLGHLLSKVAIVRSQPSFPKGKDSFVIHERELVGGREFGSADGLLNLLGNAGSGAAPVR